MFVNLMERINEDIELLEKNKEINKKELERKYLLHLFTFKLSDYLRLK